MKKVISNITRWLRSGLIQPVSALLLISTINLYSQSNKLGTIHTSVVLGGIVGGSSPGFSYNNVSPKIKDDASGIGLGGTVGIRVSIGVSKKISVGFFLEMKAPHHGTPQTTRNTLTI